MAFDDPLDSKKYVKEYTDKISYGGGYGGSECLLTNTIYGLNHQATGIPAPGNVDNKGLTFFTRPWLNLSDENLATKRRLVPLMTSRTNTYQYAIRLLLDSRRSFDKRTAHCPLVDNNQPFLPLLSNLLVGLSGWPDETLDLFVSDPGIENEVYMLVDHLGSNYNRYDLTATFRNLDGDPVMTLIGAWLLYAKAVAYGSMLPYPEMVVSKTIDYQTRIYRIVLDRSKRFIQKIACCGAAIPSANPLGSSFNYAMDQQKGQELDEISIPFTCIGYEYNDPIIIQDFNKTVELFNPKMAKGVRDAVMIALTHEEEILYNFRGYPYITDNMELQWWVDYDYYRSTISELVS